MFLGMRHNTGALISTARVEKVAPQNGTKLNLNNYFNNQIEFGPILGLPLFPPVRRPLEKIDDFARGPYKHHFQN